MGKDMGKDEGKENINWKMLHTEIQMALHQLSNYFCC